MRVRRVGPAIEIQVPAKVNLFLEVIARRPDGFHELETVLSSVSLYDTLTCEPPEEASAEPRIELACRWAAGCEALGADLARRDAAADLFGPLPATEDNLVWKAATRLRAQAGVTSGARLTLVKRIPAAAGLGGASADAAAALSALNLFWNLRWPRTKLALLASELGSDIPFFLSGGAAVCTGRGERVAGVTRLPPAWVVVCRPATGLSTPLVYRHCRPADEPAGSGALVDSWRRFDPSGMKQGLKNQLQVAAASLSPAVARIAAKLDRQSVIGHQLSGSGTSYFAVCRTARQARRVAGALRTAGIGSVGHLRTPAD